MKKASEIFSKIVFVFTVIIVAFTALLFLQGMIFGIKPYVVQSGSMEPQIHTGSLAFINTRDTDVKVGEIVMYATGKNTEIGTGNKTSRNASEGTLVTHRVVDIDENGDYIMQGDANSVADKQPVTAGQIRGTYKYSIPFLGRVYERIEQRGVVIAIAMLVALNLVSFLFGYIADAKATPPGERPE